MTALQSTSHEKVQLTSRISKASQFTNIVKLLRNILCHRLSVNAIWPYLSVKNCLKLVVVLVALMALVALSALMALVAFVALMAIMALVAVVHLVSLIVLVALLALIALVA